MNSIELYKILAKFHWLKDNFLGIFASDTIPKLKKNNIIIVNTDPSYLPGTHWFVLFKSSKYQIEYFDSLGGDENNILSSIKRRNPSTKVLLFTNINVQPFNSNLCGAYCIYFILERLSNIDLSFEELVNDIFSKDTQENDKLIKKLNQNDFQTWL